MQDSPRLIIVNSEQFGHHTDTYYYCRYLNAEFDIDYICWDHGLPKLAAIGVNVIYVSRQGGLSRAWRFAKAVRDRVERTDSDTPQVIFVNYMKIMATCLRLRHWDRCMVLDVRTGAIDSNPVLRTLKNILLRVECMLYRNVSIVSGGLASRLRLQRRAFVLPLGADELCKGDRRFESLNLLYVGTLHNRNIQAAVSGFARFSAASGHVGTFTIIGGGTNDEESDLKRLIEELGLQDSVSVLGPIPHNQLAGYFAQHTVGLSFIPMTAYYDVQPPTKTFEYLLSGMPVLATATRENKRVISERNGVIVEDNAQAVCDGLLEIDHRLVSYDSREIKDTAKEYRWPVIISDLKHYIRRVARAGELSKR